MPEIQDAKELVIRAGLELVSSGLIARTWGNVSCRIDEGSFAITPSGRAYETLTPEDIVVCRVADASYEGEIKPSSEKGVHALVYRMRPEAGFVIHTHQNAASAVSVTGIGRMPTSGREILGTSLPVASYGLPGTKKLRDGVGKALEKCLGKALIMAHHGALCFGGTYAEAFDTAQKLEAACYDYIFSTYSRKSGNSSYAEKEFYKFCASFESGMPVREGEPKLLYCSRRSGNGFVLEAEREIFCGFEEKDLPKEALIHRAIYQKRRDIRFIRQDTAGGLFELSSAGLPLRAWLDDFAQIAGRNMACAENAEPEKVVAALGNRMGVLVPGCGALCCAGNESDADAVELVAEKNAFAQMCAEVFGAGKTTIGHFDCALMRLVYKLSYSKKAESRQ